MSKIINIRPAGDNHQVVTFTGGSGAYRRKPCATCPWRVDAVGEFPAEAFRHSANTAYDMATHIFACHSSGAVKSAICAGFLLRGAAHNLAIRMKIIKNEINLCEVQENGIKLFKNYRAMAEANGVGKNEECLRECR